MFSVLISNWVSFTVYISLFQPPAFDTKSCGVPPGTAYHGSIPVNVIAYVPIGTFLNAALPFTVVFKNSTPEKLIRIPSIGFPESDNTLMFAYVIFNHTEGNMYVFPGEYVPPPTVVNP